jgi:hypothetical protein
MRIYLVCAASTDPMMTRHSRVSGSKLRQRSSFSKRLRMQNANYFGLRFLILSAQRTYSKSIESPYWIGSTSLPPWEWRIWKKFGQGTCKFLELRPGLGMRNQNPNLHWNCCGYITRDTGKEWLHNSSVNSCRSLARWTYYLIMVQRLQEKCWGEANESPRASILENHVK